MASELAVSVMYCSLGVRIFQWTGLSRALLIGSVEYKMFVCCFGFQIQVERIKVIWKSPARADGQADCKGQMGEAGLQRAWGAGGDGET